MIGDKVINTLMMYILYSSGEEHESGYDRPSLRNLKAMCVIGHLFLSAFSVVFLKGEGD